MKNKLSLTIGIPAHNEEANIANLLNTILAQKIEQFNVDEIIVMCDGCTDKTSKVAKDVAKTSKIKVSVYDDGKRFGKLKRLEKMYKLTQSDVVLICDADIVLPKNDVLTHIMVKFENPQVGLVGGNSRPVEAATLVGRLINSWSRVWYEARMMYKNGDNVHNSRGCILALKKDFAKQVEFPEDVTSDSQYLYFLALKNNFKFRFAKKAVIFFRKPDNLGDYLKQSKRSISEKDKIATIIGDWVYSEYRIPRKYKISALIKRMIMNPILTPLSAIFYLWTEYIPIKSEIHVKGGVWETAGSTKKTIQIKS